MPSQSRLISLITPSGSERTRPSEEVGTEVSTPFGEALITACDLGITSVRLRNGENGESDTESVTPTKPRQKMNPWVERTAALLSNWHEPTEPIRLCFTGTDFRLTVWRALLEIPYGATVSYASLASRAGKPNAVRAAASAVAGNPVFLLVPCHRVIRSSGKTGNYYWGRQIKQAIIEWERSNTNPEYH